MKAIRDATVRERGGLHCYAERSLTVASRKSSPCRTPLRSPPGKTGTPHSDTPKHAPCDGPAQGYTAPGLLRDAPWVCAKPGNAVDLGLNHSAFTIQHSLRPAASPSPNQIAYQPCLMKPSNVRIVGLLMCSNSPPSPIVASTARPPFIGSIQRREPSSMNRVCASAAMRLHRIAFGAECLCVRIIDLPTG